ncbi:MAG: hypothetical protein IJU76_09255 [Desulfovibrionaceae bacterium]|nr:hypothetical protein [Desulfovibrionaceae bacterium]
MDQKERIMVRCTILFLFILSNILFAQSSFALSDQEYTNLLRTSVEFKIMDQVLGKDWKELMQLTKRDKQYQESLRADQRNWVKSERDRIAKEFMNYGISRDLAYAKAALARVNELAVPLYNARLSRQDQERGVGKADGAFAADQDDPYYYADHDTSRGAVIQSLCANASFAKLYAQHKRAGESKPSMASGYDDIVWRFAEKHEGGDLEPSEFCYITVHGKTMLMHWITPADPESVEVYILTEKTEKSFSARRKAVFENDVDWKFEEFQPKQISVSVSGNTMRIKGGITLMRTDASVNNAFPESFVNSYLK